VSFFYGMTQELKPINNDQRIAQISYLVNNKKIMPLFETNRALKKLELFF